MKFSSSLKFNAVSDWWEEYIAYDTLKKYIYQLEKQQYGDGRPYHDMEASEYAALINPSRTGNTDSLFVPLLNQELKKVVMFYESQEKELLDEVKDLEEQVEAMEEAGLAAGERYMDDDDDDDEDDDDDSISRSPERRRRSLSFQRRVSRARSGTTSSAVADEPTHRRSLSSIDDTATDNEGGRSPRAVARLANKFGSLRDSISSSIHDTIWTAQTDYAYDTRLLFKRKITNLYVSLSSLKSYVEVNQSGFRKILKKYDKVTYSELKDQYLHDVVETAYPFRQESKDHLNDALQRLLTLYTKCVTRGDRSLAKQQLKLYQRENIAWERDTVWRQMIAQERRGQAEGEPTAIASLLREPGPGLFYVGSVRVTRKMLWKIGAAVVFVCLLNVSMFERVEANRCFAILVFCTVLWASEAIPLFVTSMFVPLLLILLQVVRDDKGKRLSTPDATKWVFSIMFSPTIMLLIGGFTISSALSKTNIDRILITKVLSLAGTKPRTVLLAFMGVSCFASMWISNVAAPTLCFTLIRPILRTLPPKSSFGPCLILAIALAANIGGQSSPISSPQNLIALEAMNPRLDWASWFAVSLPVSFLSLILIWILLLLSYRPERSPDGEGYLEIKAIRPTKEGFTGKQWWVTGVCAVTIGLWCVERGIEEWVGDMGVVAIVPIVAFFGTGVLKKGDFEQFMWTIVFLAMGGIALGQGVMSSGLLEVVDIVLRDMIEGYSLYSVVLILSPVVLIISTFISHTIASVLLVPIAKEVGSNLPGHHQNLLIFITGLICSAGMGMPVSGFPNQTAATVEDDLGELYLTNVDFLKNGVPASIIATLVVSTVGFLLMKLIGM